jgi:predicted short-subunit dehydrogenase-like oxidoreductase (DUF2520 family)
MRFALFGAGAVASSSIARIPGLATRLGAVASSSYRLASRIVNSLRAGYPVKGCGPLEAFPLVLVVVPPAALPRAVSCLLDVEFPWTGRQVLLCETLYDSAALERLRERGAATATLHPVEALSNRYVVEGDRQAVRQAARLVRIMGGKTIEIDRTGVGLYRAGLSLGGPLVAPLAAAAIECFRRAGATPVEASELANAIFSATLRAWLHAGKKGWSGALARGDEAQVRREIKALAEINPVAARFYRQATVFALEYFGRHPGLRSVLQDHVR